MTSRSLHPVASQALLADLEARGIRLWLDGERLRAEGPDEALTDEVLATLKAQRDALVAVLRQPARRIPARAPDAAIPMSFAQRRLWFLEQMPQEAGVYNVPLAVRIDGALDIDALRQALQAVIERHDILRTRYVRHGDEAAQVIDPPGTLDLPVDTLPAGDGPALDTLIAGEAARPFDIARDAPLRMRLIRLSADAHVLCLTIHHIACDGQSLDVLMQELGAGYRAALLGRTADPSPLPLQYADYAAWQRAESDGPAMQAHAVYWRDKLAQPLPVVELPTDRQRARLQSHEGAVVHFRLPASLVERLRALGRARHATLYMTLLAAFKLLLARCTGERDIIVGSPVAKRHPAELEPLIGLFVNTLVLRSRIRPSDPFEQVLATVRQTVLEALDHQDLPFEKLIEIVQPERDLSRNPLFQIKFRLENAPPEHMALPGLTLRRLPQTVISAKLDLGMDLYETADGIIGGIEYNASLFSADSMERLVSHYDTLLRAIADAPRAPVGTLTLLAPAQRAQQLDGWNDTAKPWRSDTCFHYLFEEAVARHGERVAVEFAGSNGHTVALSYGELNRRANQLAHWLRAEGMGPEQVVGICMDRSVDMMVALLGVLKAGAAWLPLDAQYPQERLAYMLDDARVPVLLSQSHIALPTVARRLDVDRDWPPQQPDHNPPRVNTPRHLAYVIYTSGSTGRPKGVLIEHGGLVNLTEDKLRKCDVRAGDCVLQFFSFSFDACIPEIIMPLAVGGRLLMAPQATLLPGPALAELMERHAVTHVTMTPSALVGLPDGDYPSLRMVLVGGEAPSAELMAQWSRGGRVFINAYGPTETTVNASMVYCGNGHPLAATLAPSANKQLYVLDDQLELLPVGAPGELCIAGVGLARGYLNRPDLTARQFVPNPFRTGPDDSACLYRTGDLACLLPDGRIRLLGRIDKQVKIRGFRVEPGDVEHALAEHPAVHGAVVLALDDAFQGKRLAAWAVPAAAEPPSPAQMRQALAERLPHFMLPATFQWLDALPLTPNGKIDAEALAALERAPETRDAAAPGSDTEIRVATAFATTLNRQDLGIDDDFFDAGGHSLLATRLIALLLPHYPAVDITVIDLFEAPSVRGLARRIDHKLKLARLGDSQAEGEREEIEL
jgi:amino acid adenylation domain-containing protein